MKSKVQVIKYCKCGKILRQGNQCSLCWNSSTSRKERKQKLKLQKE